MASIKHWSRYTTAIPPLLCQLICIFAIVTNMDNLILIHIMCGPSGAASRTVISPPVFRLNLDLWLLSVWGLYILFVTMWISSHIPNMYRLAGEISVQMSGKILGELMGMWR